jgi:predicted ribosomally synthesized peptide with SipW-like signal peptide
MSDYNDDTTQNSSRITLTKRKALGGVTAVGLASAGAGAGTLALFSDEEEFENNSIQAGQLDLFVDYATTVTRDGVTTSVSNGTIQGGVSGEYQIADVNPGDTGFLAFCPRIVDNEGWLFAGSADGVTDYENGQTEEEGNVDPTGGGSLGSTDSGEGAGELSEAIQVDVEYCEPNTTDPQGPGDFNTISELSRPEDYTFAAFFKELESGLLLDGEPDEDDGDPSGTQEYPSSPDQSIQNGPCLCISWELPLEVGNEVQSDAVRFDVTFAARQRHNNADPKNPFVDLTVGSASGFDYSSIQAAVDAASPGEVISVDSGTYEEEIDIGKSVSLVAAPFESPRIEGDGNFSDGDNSPNTNAKGITLDADNVLLKGLSVEKFNNGLRVPGGASVEGLCVSNCHFDNNDDGWYVANPNESSSATFDDILVWNTTFNNNLLKGLYIEKLSTARFYNIEIKNSGTIDPSASPRNTGVGITNGMDINLKFGDYEDISIRNSTFEDSGLDPGLGDDLYGALVMKARGTGSDSSYIPGGGPPGATVDNIVVENTTFEFDSSTSGDRKAIQTGEPGLSTPLKEPTPGDDNDGDGDDDITITGNTYTNVDTQLNDLTQ